MAEKLISVDRMETVLSLFGNYDENVNLIQKEYNVVILGRGDDIKITGDEENVFNASEAVNSLIALINKGEAITEQTIRYVFTLVREGKQYEIKHMSDDGVCVTVSGKLVKEKDYRHGRWSCGNGQDLSCGGNGGKGFQGTRGGEDNPHTSCG